MKFQCFMMRIVCNLMRRVETGTGYFSLSSYRRPTVLYSLALYLAKWTLYGITRRCFWSYPCPPTQLQTLQYCQFHSYLDQRFRDLQVIQVFAQCTLPYGKSWNSISSSSTNHGAQSKHAQFNFLWVYSLLLHIT